MPSLPYRRLVVGALTLSLVPVASAFAGGTTKVSMDEFSLKASPKSVTAGRVTFDARNNETSAAMFAPEVVDPVADVLVELAGSGRALEFGIGTGRIALPLAARGI